MGHQRLGGDSCGFWTEVTRVSALKFNGIGIDWLQACLIFGELVKGKGLKVKGLQNLGYFLQKDKSNPKWQARTSFLKLFFTKS